MCDHEPDPKSVLAAEGADWIIDVWCAKCGRSGSLRIDPKAVDFGDGDEEPPEPDGEDFRGSEAAGYLAEQQAAAQRLKR